MTREEKCKLAIEKGFTYDEVTGNIYGIRGNKIKNKSYGYIRLKLYLDKKEYELKGHQFAFYYKYGKVVEQIDHIDCDRSNNKISNLREVNNQQNSFNKKNTKGIYYIKSKNRYTTSITIDYKRIYLGCFETEQEARQVYLDAKQKYHII